MKKRLITMLIISFGILASYNTFALEEVEVYEVHAMAMHGQPKYGPDFKHFDYVNPNAPKGGTVVFGDYGTYDNLHPFILKGESAAGLGNLFETLTTRALDEAFTEYGLLAETIEWPADRSWITFTLRPEARWHDGEPVTVADVIWSLEAIKTKGHPFYRAYYANLAKAEKVGERKVKFTFSGPPNPELPLITGQLPILPKHYWEGRDFEATTLEPPIGSGPYKIQRLDPGRSITYERDPNYWGRNLQVNVGQYNFDIIRYDYYKDEGVEREALRAGKIDIFQENISKEWATGYNIPMVEQDLLIKREIPHENPQGMQAFMFNTRREIFKDRRVREAIGYAFDFEWTNKNLFYDSYTRTTSYFSNSELASSGLPSKAELEILNKYRGQVPDEVFTKAFSPPQTDGSGSIRGNVRSALALLKTAGWEIRNSKLTNVETGTPMNFEILLRSPSWERIVLPLKKNLEKLGIEVKVRTVDTAQYQNRLDSHDFDMYVYAQGQSLSPGNEQRHYWHSESADINGSRNFAGIKDPVIDELIDLIISAPDRESLINQAKALDRVLLWNHYVIPHWHISAYRVLYWDKLDMPQIRPRYALGMDTWWVDSKLEASLVERKRALK